MKNRILLSVTALLSALCLAVAVVLPSGVKTLDFAASTVGAVSESQNSFELAAAEPYDTVAMAVESESAETEYTEAELKSRLTLMLSLNFCFGDAFLKDAEAVQCATLSLTAYAADLPGIGLAVNTCLIEGFVKSFYGVELSAEAYATDGFVAVPVTDCGTRFYEIISVTETEEGFEVIAKTLSYFGGDGCSEEAVRAVFKPDTESEFGFNLVFAEIL